MIFDRMDGSQTNLQTQGPLGILRQSGLDITMSEDVATINFDEVGGYSQAGRYREMFLQLRSEGMEKTLQSGSTIEVQVKADSPLSNITRMSAFILGKAIQSGDTLGQAADRLIGNLAEKAVSAERSIISHAAVSGGGHSGVSVPTYEI